MIQGNNGSVLISSLGWVDHGAIWIFDAVRGEPRTMDLGSGARYVSVHARNQNFFCVAHHFDGGRFELTIHRFVEPETILARTTVGEIAISASEPSMWREVPGLYVEYLEEPWRDFVLVSVAPDGTTSTQQLRWYDDSYDKGYQGVVDVVPISDTRALISVQRCSTLVFHDLETGDKTGLLKLADRGGNPELTVRPERSELWTIDYDTLVVVDSRTWKVKASRQLQSDAGGVRQFLGKLSFSVDGQRCLVARPFSGDAVELDPESLKIRGSAMLSQQPLEAAFVSSNRVIARDWKTGGLLSGTIKRKWWPA